MVMQYDYPQNLPQGVGVDSVLATIRGQFNHSGYACAPKKQEWSQYTLDTSYINCNYTPSDSSVVNGKMIDSSSQFATYEFDVTAYCPPHKEIPNYGICFYHKQIDGTQEMYASEDEYIANRPSLRLVLSGLSGDLQLLSHQVKDSIQRGKRSTIFWNDESNKAVKIELYKSGSPLFTISDSTPNDGIFTWHIPDTLSIGSGYEVKLSYTDGSEETKDNSFTLIPRKSFVHTKSGTPEGWYTVDEKINITCNKEKNFYCWNGSGAVNCNDRYDYKTTLTVPDEDVKLIPRWVSPLKLQDKLWGLGIPFSVGIADTIISSSTALWKLKDTLVFPIGKIQTGRYRARMRYSTYHHDPIEIQLAYNDGLSFTDDSIGYKDKSTEDLTTLSLKPTALSDVFDTAETEIFNLFEKDFIFLEMAEKSNTSDEVEISWIELELVDKVSVSQSVSKNSSKFTLSDKSNTLHVHESGEFSLQIITASGRLLKEKTLIVSAGNSYDLSLTERLSAGVYFISSEFNGTYRTQRVVIE